MTNQTSLKLAGIAVITLGLLAYPETARAGFQWVDPAELGGSPSAAPQSGGLSLLSPVVVDGKAAESSGLVTGFADHVPLAVALRQILPSGYGFSVDPDVDSGLIVSFRGGRPWRETLKDALDPVGLAMRENGSMIVIGHSFPAAVASNAVPTPVVGLSSAPPVPIMASGAHSALLSPHAGIPLDGALAGSQSWDAVRGENLQKVLAAWSKRAQVEFNWMSEYDYPLQASVHITGTYQDAVRKLLAGFEGAHPQPIAKLHMNPELGQMAIVVESRGNSYTN